MMKFLGFPVSRLSLDSWHTANTSPAVCSVLMLGMLFLVEVNADLNIVFGLDI